MKTQNLKLSQKPKTKILTKLKNKNCKECTKSTENVKNFKTQFVTNIKCPLSNVKLRL